MSIRGYTMLDFNSFTIKKKPADKSKAEIVKEPLKETVTPEPMHAAGPFLPPSLQFIKSKLDRRSNTVSTFDGDDIAAMDADNFEKICAAFQKYFNEELYSKQSKENIEKQFSSKDQIMTEEMEAKIPGLQQKSITIHQLNAIWLYMAFSLFTHKQANHPALTGSDKLNKINALDAELYAKIGGVIQSINGTKIHFLKNNSLDFHQKLPMVHNNLFHYFQILRNNPRIDQKLLLEKLPLSFSKEVLASSCDKMKTRKETKQSISEYANNAMLFRSFRENCPQIFEPLPKQNGMYIDDAIGLELDCPHRMKLTFETDGPHHYYPSGQHDFIHHLKSVALRETGWTRISLKTDSSEEKNNIAFMTKILNISNVGTFAEAYQELGIILNELRTKIVQYQSMLLKANLQEKPFVMQATLDLLNIENALRKQFLDPKHLKNLLKSYKDKTTFSISETKDKILGFQLNMQEEKKAIDAFLKQERMMSCEINPMKQSLQVLSEEITVLKEKYASRSDSLQKHSNMLSNPTVNKEKIVEIKKYIQEMKPYLQKIESEIAEKETDMNELVASISYEEKKLNKSQYEKAILNYKTAECQLNQLQDEVNSFFTKALPTEALKQQLKSTKTSMGSIDLVLNAQINELRNNEIERKRAVYQENVWNHQERMARQSHVYNNQIVNAYNNRNYEYDRRDNRDDRDYGRSRQQERFYDNRSYTPYHNNGYNQEINVNKRPPQADVPYSGEFKKPKR